MQVLLTGATGFVGSHLLEQLVARGDDVCVLALPDTLGKLSHGNSVRVITGGLDNPGALMDATRGVEVVYHIAGVHMSALRQAAQTSDLAKVNVLGTQNLLAACVANRVRRFVFTSSISVYNKAPWPFLWPVGEDFPLRTSGSGDLRSYAQSKIDAERLIQVSRDQSGMETVILRPTAVYGPSARWVEEIIAQQIKKAQSGWTERSNFAFMQWIHVRDLSSALMRAGLLPQAANQIFNAAGSQLFSLVDLAAIVLPSAGLPPPPRGQSENSTMGGRYSLRYDIRKAEKQLGFSPQVQVGPAIWEIQASMPSHPKQPAGKGSGKIFAGYSDGRIGANRWRPN